MLHKTLTFICYISQQLLHISKQKVNRLTFALEAWGLELGILTFALESPTFALGKSTSKLEAPTFDLETWSLEHDRSGVEQQT